MGHNTHGGYGWLIGEYVEPLTKLEKDNRDNVNDILMQGYDFGSSVCLTHSSGEGC